MTPAVYRRRSYLVSAVRLANGNYVVTLPDGSRDTWLAEEFDRAFEPVEAKENGGCPPFSGNDDDGGVV